MSSQNSILRALPAIAAILVFVQPGLSATTLYVDEDAPGPIHDGSSWCDAFLGLQEALAEAEASGGEVTEIRVAAGTYTPAGPNGDREATFQLLNGVALLGGYAGCGAFDPDQRDVELFEAILSGDLNGDDGPDFENNQDNSCHVTTGSGTDETALLDGFTIIGGNASDDHCADASGGGMFNDNGSPTLTNCTFTGNASVFVNSGSVIDSGGGGMWNSGSPMLTNCTFSRNLVMIDAGYIENSGGAGMWNSGNPRVSRCIFTRNSTNHRGGGIWNSGSPTLTNCTFTENSTSGGIVKGGGIYQRDGNPTLIGCTFTGNSATGSIAKGGGIYHRDGNPTMTGCTFNENLADPDGGGIYQFSSTLTLMDCTFTANRAGDEGSAAGGGAIWSAGSFTLINCTFVENSAEFQGGAAYYPEADLSATLSNCTFTGNTANRGGAMWTRGSPTLTNCTFSRNSAMAPPGPGAETRRRCVCR